MPGKSTKAQPESLPEFTSDRMRLLGPLVTPRVLELARMRVTTLDNFFLGERLAVPDEMLVVKLALLVAYEINPFEDWSAEEEALRGGISSKTLRARKADEMTQLRRLVLRKTP